MYRDFTYIDDLVHAIRLLMYSVPDQSAKQDEISHLDSQSTVAPFRIVNIGNSNKVRLLDFIDAIEACLNREAIKNFMEMQPGDVPATLASTELLYHLTGYRPNTSVEEGIKHFIDWFRAYYGK